MIWANGYIKFKDSSVQMFDEDGNPIEETEHTWSDFIECGFECNTNLTAKSGENSEFKAQSCTVRIKYQPIKERLKLFDSDRNCLGEFVVRSANDYKFIDETHIVCQSQ